MNCERTNTIIITILMFFVPLLTNKPTNCAYLSYHPMRSICASPNCRFALFKANFPIKPPNFLLVSNVHKNTLLTILPKAGSASLFSAFLLVLANHPAERAFSHLGSRSALTIAVPFTYQLPKKERNTRIPFYP